MRTFQRVLWTTLSVAGLVMVGCDRREGEHGREGRGQGQYAAPQPQPVQAAPPVVVQPQPVYVDPQPQVVIVQQAPPARPSPQHIWIAGSWNWDNQRYSWQAGRYEIPPQPNMVWVAPRYDSDPHGHRYTPGRWQGKGDEHDRRN